jgi:hypothetical protein
LIIPSCSGKFIPVGCRGEAQGLFINKAVPAPLFINRFPGPQRGFRIAPAPLFINRFPGPQRGFRDVPAPLFINRFPGPQKGFGIVPAPLFINRFSGPQRGFRAVPATLFIQQGSLGLKEAWELCQHLFINRFPGLQRGFGIVPGPLLSINRVPPFGIAVCLANTMEKSIPRGGASSWNRGLPCKCNGKVDSKRRRLLLESRFALLIQWKSRFQEAAPPLGIAACLANTMEKSIPRGGASPWNCGLPCKYNRKIDSRRLPLGLKGPLKLHLDLYL